MIFCLIQTLLHPRKSRKYVSSAFFFSLKLDQKLSSLLVEIAGLIFMAFLMAKVLTEFFHRWKPTYWLSTRTTDTRCTVGFWCQTIHKKFLQIFDIIFGLRMMVKSGLEKNILKFHSGLQSCCCPVQKNLPRKA